MQLSEKYEMTYKEKVTEENFQDYYLEFIRDLDSAHEDYEAIARLTEPSQILEAAQLLKAYTRRYRSLYKFAEKKYRKEIDSNDVMITALNLDNLRNLSFRFYNYNLQIHNSLSQVSKLPQFYTSMKAHALTHATECLGIEIYSNLLITPPRKIEYDQYLIYTSLVEKVLEYSIKNTNSKDTIDILISSIAQHYEILKLNNIGDTQFRESVIEQQEITIANIEVVGEILSSIRMSEADRLIQKAKEQLEEARQDMES
jgi:hypothetical protein